MAEPQAVFSNEKEQLAIEESANAELEAIFDEYNSPHAQDHTPDTLNQRFIIHVNESLPDLDTPYSKAYRATDQSHPEREVYAVVLEPEFDYRVTVMDALEGHMSQNLLTQFGRGPVYLSNDRCVKYVVIYERPQGKRLSEVMKERRVPEHQIYEIYLSSIDNGLQIFREQNLVHGYIHPDNIFVGERVVLGECVSQPCGYSQEYIYEPIERILANEQGKGHGTNFTDSFAMGILMLDMVGAMDRIRKMDRDVYIDAMLTVGSYTALALKLDVSEVYEDLLRGTLTEKADERWTLENVHAWIKGRRSNLIPPTSHRDGSRPLNYKGTDLFSMRAIAHKMSLDWQAAIKELDDSKVTRWVEMCVHDPDIAELTDRFISTAGVKRNENAKAEAVSRLISVFDPHGPVRYRQLKCHLDGFGQTVLNAYKNNLSADILAVMQLIQGDYHTFWSDLYADLRPDNTFKLMWQMQKVKECGTLQSMGFGVERTIYELNDSMPCQYDLLKPLHVTDLESCLYALDAMSKENRDSALSSRELGAFLACKLGINKELGFRELSSLPGLQRHPELVIIRMLGQARITAKADKLIGLSTWCAMRISNLLNEFKNRNTRRMMRKQLKNAAMTGIVNNVMGILVNKSAAENDNSGYQKAQLVYQYNNARINNIQSPIMRDTLADDLGGRIAVFVSYCILFMTFFLLYNQYESDFF